jgi:signal transduction histidine kinase/DNA-binding response OmpR family regulator
MDRVEYAYMLKGLDNRWYIADEHHQVAFRNIPAGKYRFVVKTRIRNQVWSKQTTGLDIAVIPPPWLTWWAKLGYVLLTVCIGYMVLHAYKKRLDMEALYDMEKKNREREQTLNDERLRFFTNITHELRTPLTLILGPLEDIQKSPTLVDKDAQKISLIRQSALRLLSLINQILEFRKVETQNKKLCVGRYNLATLIGEIGAKYKELNRKSSVEIVIKSVPDDDLTLYFDKEVVTIIVDNLMSNALKYTDRGEVTLSAYLTERAGIRYTEICVSDTGQGIDAEALPHVFERFYQGEQGKRVSGTGIGLALVKSLVELHEGEISVESALNKGSTFRFTLLTDNTYPYMQHIDSDASIPETESSEIEKDSREETSNDKSVLLIVEDNPDICHYIAESFADRFDVKVASNGQQGLEQALLYIPDIIISDIMMPVMDGITLCRRLKSDVRTSHIPIILLTAKDSLEDKEEGYETGADSYLTKPFSATLLHSRVNNLLETRRKLAEQFAAHTTRTNPIEEKRTLLAESLNKLDREFLDKVTALIEEHLSSEKIDIPYLSDKLCMSGSTLYRKIRALTGLSTNEYIRKVKLQHAERLLLEGKYQVSEVAFKVGFNSVVYFRQCFKDEFGVPPSEYLKKLF